MEQSPPRTQRALSGVREKISYRGCDSQHLFTWEHKTGKLSTKQRNEVRPVLAERDGLACGECGIVLPEPRLYEVDHRRKWRDHFGNILYDNHVAQLRLLCVSCNRKLQRLNSSLFASGVRERKIAAAVLPYNAPEEIIRHDEGVPIVTRKLIELIREGKSNLDAVKRAHQAPKPGVDYVPLREDPLYKQAVKSLKLKNVVGSIVQATDIAVQTVYHYLIGPKNEIDGWLHVVDGPDGKLLEFVDQENYRRPAEEVYQLVRPGRERT